MNSSQARPKSKLSSRRVDKSRIDKSPARRQDGRCTVDARMLPALVSLAAVARCELMVVSPGTATAVSLDALCASCRALAALRSTSGARVTLLLREPDLEHEHIKSVVRDLAPLFAPDCLVLHEKCAGARLVASEHGLGVHVKSTLGCTDRGATRTG